MLKKPDFDLPMVDGKTCVRVENGSYFASLDKAAAVLFLYSLHWFATDALVGEEIDITSNNRNEMSGRGEVIGYCEFNLTPSHPNQKNQNARCKPYGTYDPKTNRLDYFISAEEAGIAYEKLNALLERNTNAGRVEEITLFETLTIRVLNERT